MSSVIEILCLTAKKYFIDENGEPIEKNTYLTFNEILSIEENPLLKFVVQFNAFSNNGEEETNNLVFLLLDGILFIGQFLYSTKDLKVLENNLWLLNKDTYFTSLGTPKTKIGYYNYAISKTTGDYQNYFQELLEKEKSK